MAGKTAAIRDANALDVPTLLAIDPVAAAGSEERRRAIAGHVAAGRCIVAQIGSTVVGYAAFSPGSFFGRDFVEFLIVETRHRRRGIGSRLLAAAVARASTSRVFTSTNASNHAMRALLAAQGWHVSGVLDGLDDDDPERVYFVDR